MDGFMNYCPFISIDGLLHLSILVLFKSFPISHCADSVHTRMNYRMPVAFWLGTGTLHSVICCAMSICANAGSTLVQQHAEYQHTADMKPMLHISEALEWYIFLSAMWAGKSIFPSKQLFLVFVLTCGLLQISEPDAKKWVLLLTHWCGCERRNS